MTGSSNRIQVIASKDDLHNVPYEMQPKNKAYIAGNTFNIAGGMITNTPLKNTGKVEEPIFEKTHSLTGNK